MISMTRSGHNYVKNNIMSWKKYKYLNVESVNPINYNNFIKKHKVVGERTNIILVRDLLNWLASYLKIQLDSKNNMKQVSEYIKIWESHIKECAYETNYIKDLIIVEYDKFKNLKSYRKEICGEVGGIYNEKFLNVVPRNGSYSSFDKKKYIRSGSKMNTTERYKYFINSEQEDLYLSFLKNNPEAIRLYEGFFVLNEEQKEIINRIKK